MNKISTFLNYIITGATICFLVYCWSFFSTNNIMLSVVIAGLCFTIFTLVFFLVKSRLDSSKKIANSDKENFENCKLAFNLMPDFECFNLLSKLAPKNILQNSNPTSFRENIILTFFDCAKLDPKTFLIKYKSVMRSDIKSITVYCFEIDEQAISIVNSISETFISIVTFSELYLTLKQSNLLPRIAMKELPKKNYKAKLMKVLSHQKATGYAIIGAFLLLFSLISPFRLYYQIFASVLIVFSAVVFFAKISD